MRKILAAILAILLGAGVRLQAGPLLPQPLLAPVPLSSTAPATRATDIPPVSPYPAGPLSGCGCSNCPREKCCWRRLLAWATYCPKERIGCCRHQCYFCQYKGTLPYYMFQLNPHCVEGTGLHPTVPPLTCPSHKGCAHCRTGNSCGGCTNGPVGVCANGPAGACK